MKAIEIISKLEELCPKRFACDWDNVGLHVGREQMEVSGVYITLDADEEAIAAAMECNAQLIISHHPLLFHGIQQVNDAGFMGNRVLTMVEQGIGCYCMHTNFDVKGGMAQVAAEKMGLINLHVLEETIEGEGIGRVGDLPYELSLQEFCEQVKQAFGLDHVNFYGDTKQRIRRVATVPGSGKDDVELAMEMGADVFVTGDMSYHVAIDAVAQGMSVIDAGHYGLEQIFIDIVADYLEKSFPELMIVQAVKHNPRRFL